MLQRQYATTYDSIDVAARATINLLYSNINTPQNFNFLGECDIFCNLLAGVKERISTKATGNKLKNRLRLVSWHKSIADIFCP